MQKPFSLKIVLMIIAALLIAWGIMSWIAPDTEQSSTEEMSEALPPQLSIETLLNAVDVEAGLLTAVQQNNEAALKNWQNSLLSAAHEVGYDTEQLAFLQGRAGIDFLRFKGRRLWYHQEVETALYQGLAFEPIAAKFPESADLHSATQALFEKRNIILDEITKTLLEDAKQDTNSVPLSYETASEYALQLWQQQFNSTAEN